MKAEDQRARVERTSWLNFALNPFPELFAPVGSGALFKGKDAFLRSALPIARSKLRTST